VKLGYFCALFKIAHEILASLTNYAQNMMTYLGEVDPESIFVHNAISPLTNPTNFLLVFNDLHKLQEGFIGV